MTIIVTAKGTNASRDYAWLLDVVPRRLHRDDLGDDLPDFVMLAEKRINGDLRAQLQDAVASLATTEGAQFITLPPSILAIKSLTIPGHGTVDYMAPAQFNTEYARSGASGIPKHYTQIGSALYFGPPPGTAVSLSAVVRGAVPALADAAGTNWLIEQHPEVYLAATMCEALLHIRDYPNHAVWDAKYNVAIAALDTNDWEYAGTMTLRAPT